MSDSTPSGKHAFPVIRRLSSKDAAAFRTLRLEAMRIDPDCFASSHDEEAVRPEAWFVERLIEDGVFAAELDGRPVGLVGFTQETKVRMRHKGTIYGMFVHPDARGLGLGAALLSAALEHARERVENVLLAVTSTNTPAIRLYESAGFVRYGLEPRSLRMSYGLSDDLLFYKRLD